MNDAVVPFVNAAGPLSMTVSGGGLPAQDGTASAVTTTSASAGKPTARRSIRRARTRRRCWFIRSPRIVGRSQARRNRVEDVGAGRIQLEHGRAVAVLVRRRTFPCERGNVVGP